MCREGVTAKLPHAVLIWWNRPTSCLAGDSFDHLVIFIPESSEIDPTMSKGFHDKTFEYLEKIEIKITRVKFTFNNKTRVIYLYIYTREHKECKIYPC